MSALPNPSKDPSERALESLFGPELVARSSAWIERASGSGVLRFGLDRPNRRLKMVGASSDDLERDEFGLLAQALDDGDSAFDKLIVYGRSADELPWIRAGLFREGEIDSFFQDKSAAHVWVRIGSGRDQNENEASHFDTVMRCLEKDVRIPPPVSAGYHFRRMELSDVPHLGPLLRDAFPEYPVDIEDAALRESMLSGANLFAGLVSSDGELAAVASAEIDRIERNAEMTDCVTHPDHRGNGLMAQLLWKLEEELHDETGITALYTLARAGEFGMNATFARLGYRFTGRMLNNCRMPTGWESMNIWCRDSTPRFGVANGTPAP